MTVEQNMLKESAQNVTDSGHPQNVQTSKNYSLLAQRVVSGPMVTIRVPSHRDSLQDQFPKPPDR
eukprot:3651338-Amphidinium_carterae.1